MLENPSPSWDGIDLILNLGVRVGFFGYWLFDNLLILAKMKLFSKPAKSFLKPAMLSWWTALMLNLVLNLKKLRSLSVDINKIRKQMSRDRENTDKYKDQIKGKIKTTWIQIIIIILKSKYFY